MENIRINADREDLEGIEVIENAGLMRTANVIDRILKVFQGIAIACAAVAAIFILLTLIFGEKVIADASVLELGFLRIKFAGDMGSYLDMGSIKLNIVMTLVSVIIPLGAGWFCMKVLREILAPMKGGKPFAEGVSKKIKKLGWTVLIGGGVYEIARAAEEFFTVRAYRVAEFISHPNIESVGIEFSKSSIHPWFIFAALLLFFLSFVFRCGEKLQREYDETL